MGYKLKTGKHYDNGIGQDMPEAYAWIDTVIIESRKKTANVILKITASKQASIDMKKELETHSIIVSNHKVEVDGVETEVNDFDNYIEEILSAVAPSANIKKKSYKYFDDKYSGKSLGFFVKDDWESDE